MKEVSKLLKKMKAKKERLSIEKEITSMFLYLRSLKDEIVNKLLKEGNTNGAFIVTNLFFKEIMYICTIVVNYIVI